MGRARRSTGGSKPKAKPRTKAITPSDTAKTETTLTTEKITNGWLVTESTWNENSMKSTRKKHFSPTKPKITVQNP